MFHPDQVVQQVSSDMYFASTVDSAKVDCLLLSQEIRFSPMN